VCGLAGILTATGEPSEHLDGIVGRMISTLVHRGPDDQGTWSDAGVALGLRRLAIVDLSAEGHQPMHSASGRWVVAFNGEVYNHVELRHELAALGHAFRGHSDTEVLLAAVEQWGISGAVRRFVGMFAIALWDRAERRLTLVRDRLGIKPLFVYRRAGTVAFASELKALAETPGFDGELDPDAVTAYLRYLYVPAPASIFRHVRKLEPGHLLHVADPREPLAAPEPYWSAEEAALAGAVRPWSGSDAETVDEAERLLRDAVALRMRADVPVGAFLSGGIDSSLVVARMAGASPRPPKTFTIGFGEHEFDERAAARRVSEQLGTDHVDCRLTASDALALVPELPAVFDEPLADPSQLPTLLVSRIARRHVTVALSGDGGDELFAGYNRYAYGERVFRRALRVPRRARQFVAAGLTGLSPRAWDRVYRTAQPVLPQRLQQRIVGEKLHKVGRLLPLRSAPEMYRSLVSAVPDPTRLVVDGREGADTLSRTIGGETPLSFLDRMLLADQRTYLADDLLAKVDRASMATSLEVRVPILDHRVVEFAWRLPATQKVRDGKGKWLLRQVLRRYLPDDCIDRPKSGFSVPIDAWLRGPLREWAGDLLSADRISRMGVLHARHVADAWSSFSAGGAQSALGIWALVTLVCWHEHWERTHA
jgi:asparagine synthase (glutamine-hydrolysing)